MLDQESTSGSTSLEARMGELQNTLALLIAASAKTTPIASDLRSTYSPSPPHRQDRFEYGAFGEVVAAAATTSQMNGPYKTSDVVDDSVAQGGPNVRHKGPADSIGQSRLPLTFGLADVMASPSQGAHVKRGDAYVEGDLVKSLALKVLEIPLFSGVQLQRQDFDASAVYHMAGKMMHRTVQMPANVAMREVEKFPILMMKKALEGTLPRREQMLCDLGRDHQERSLHHQNLIVA